uniref:Uncharacterized protein n=1 Tax=Timema douglasi TaxID=61478 RepID=A0A7R8VD72_TIMDO|nr:unnamed protein product [Timema douglasi]
MEEVLVLSMSQFVLQKEGKLNVSSARDAQNGLDIFATEETQIRDVRKKLTVRVEYYVNENTFKERLQLYFIKNQRSSEYTKTEINGWRVRCDDHMIPSIRRCWHYLCQQMAAAQSVWLMG